MRNGRSTASPEPFQSARRDALGTFVLARPADQAFITHRSRTYAQTFQAESGRPRTLRRWLQSFRAPTTGDRILAGTVSGISVARIRRILERENCDIENVRLSDTEDPAFIDFVFREDNGYCMAVLTDRVRNDTYARCSFVTNFRQTLDLRRVDELNFKAKYVKCYTAGTDRLFVEYSFLTIDLPDSAIAANIDMYHGSVQQIAANNFSS